MTLCCVPSWLTVTLLLIDYHHVVLASHRGLSVCHQRLSQSEFVESEGEAETKPDQRQARIDPLVRKDGEFSPRCCKDSESTQLSSVWYMLV